MEHELKIWPEFFDAVERGDKTAEIRVNNRPFAVGDRLITRRACAPGGCGGTRCRQRCLMDDSGRLQTSAWFVSRILLSRGRWNQMRRGRYPTEEDEE